MLKSQTTDENYPPAKEVDNKFPILTWAELRSALMHDMTLTKNRAHDPALYMLVTRLIGMDEREAELEKLRSEDYKGRYTELMQIYIKQDQLIKIEELKAENEGLKSIIAKHKVVCLIGIRDIPH